MNQQYVILDLKNGFKCEGTLVTIDKVNFKIVLTNAKKYVTEEDGTMKEENFPNLEIPKDEIKEVKIVQYEQDTPKTNINAIPENRMNQAHSNLTKPKTYDKGESFFDNLIPMNNREAKNETIKYNEKNMETFNLTEEQLNSTNNYRGRGGRGRGGRGGYRGGNRGGNNYGQSNYGQSNYNNYNNNNYNNNNYNNNYNNNNYNNNFNNNRNRGGRGGQFRNNNYNNNNRGGYGNNNYNTGGFNNNRGGYRKNYNNNFNNNYQNNNNNNNFDDFNEDNNLYTNNVYQDYSNNNNNNNFGGQERSIYDKL
jgi:hypothetical protein